MKIKKILLIVLVMGICVLSGCSEDPEEVIDSYGTVLEDVKDRNNKALEKIRDAGFITKDECKSLKQGLSKSIQEKLEDNNSSNTEMSKIVMEAIVENTAFVCNASSGEKLLKLKQAGKDIAKTGDAIKPLTVFNKGDLKSLNDRMSYSIWVIKPSGGSYKGQNIGAVANALKKLDKKEGDFSKLTQAEKDLINNLYSDSKEKLVDTTTIPVLKNTTWNDGDLDSGLTNNKLGKDYGTASNQKCGVKLRLYEINPKFLKAIGANGKAKEVAQKYVIDNVNKRLLLVNYPIYVMNKLKRTSDGKWKCIFDYRIDSMKVSLKDGTVTDKDGKKISKSPYHVNSGNTSASFMFGPKSNKGTNATAYNVETIYYDTNDKKLKTKTTKIDDCVKVCLADYLELTYLPDVVSGEDYIALGRKIRILKLSGSKNTQIAKFIDKKGKAIDTNIKIYAKDLMDVRSGYDVEQVVNGSNGTTKKVGKKWKTKKVKLAIGVKPSKTTISKTKSNGTVGDTMTTIKFKTIHYVKSSICAARTFGFNGNSTYEYWGEDREDTSIALGSENLFGANDADKYYNKLVKKEVLTKPLMFGLNLDIDLFKSELYSGWITVEGKGGDKGSLEWWNSWLKKCKYDYTIDKDALMNALGMNYQISMNDADDTLILDLETISKIQENYDQQAREDKAKTIRTWFIGLGFVCIAYSILVLAAWVLDTSMVGGPKLLTKITFGKCVAVQNNLGVADSGDKRYMTFGRALAFALTVGSIGVTIILLDYVTIITFIVKTFGTFGDIIQDIMLNK